MENALRKNKVLLWGLEVVPKSILDPYDIGNKNPRSLKQKGRKKGKYYEDSESENEEEINTKVNKNSVPKDVFDVNVIYSYDDLPFLNKELKRLEDERDDYDEQQNHTSDLKEIYRLGDLSEAVDLIIDDITYEIKKLTKVDKVEAPKQTVKSKSKSVDGKGFKKGSPEALEHAKKMREKKLAKSLGEIPTDTPIIRKTKIVKGSDEAKEIGKRLMEARKAKRTNIKEEVDVKQPLKSTVVKRPWYYIGDIPPRYREATMEEAIKHNKVSEYGKYQADPTMVKFYKNYNIFLSKNISDINISTQTTGIKRRINKIDNLIEKLEIKIDKETDTNKKNIAIWELSELMNERKDIISGYYWLMKELYERKGKTYTKEKFPKPVIKLNVKELPKTKPQPIKEVKPIKETKKSKDEKLKIAKQETKDTYVKGNDEIKITSEYFDKDGKLKPEKSKELYDKGIMLDKSLYHLDDYRKYIYVSKFYQVDNILEDIMLQNSELKETLKKNKKSKKVEEPEYESQLFKKRTKKEEEEYYAAREKEAYERAEKEEKEKKEQEPLTEKELDKIFNSIKKGPQLISGKQVEESPKEKSKPIIKKSKSTKTVILTPELEEEHNIMEYLKLDDEDKNDEMMVEMAKMTNDVRAKQIVKLSEKLGIKFKDPNI